MSDKVNNSPNPPEPRGSRIPIWDRLEHRKIYGKAAPLRKDLATYLSKNENCDVYQGQDYLLSQSRESDLVNQDMAFRLASQDPGRVTMWHRHKKCKVSGNAAPRRKNIHTCLERNSKIEIYIGQDRCGDGYHAYDCEKVIGSGGMFCRRDEVYGVNQENPTQHQNANKKPDLATKEGGDIVREEQGEVFREESGEVVRGDQGEVVRGDQGEVVRGDQGEVVREDQGEVVREDQGEVDREDQGEAVCGEQGKVFLEAQGEHMRTGQHEPFREENILSLDLPTDC